MTNRERPSQIKKPFKAIDAAKSTQLPEHLQNLPQPLETLSTPHFTAHTFLAKPIGHQDWTNPTLYQIYLEAKKSYARYGERFGQPDRFDAKAAHFLTLIRYPINLDGTTVEFAEWHSVRYIPTWGTPPNSEDLNFYVCGPTQISPLELLIKTVSQKNVHSPQDHIFTQSGLCVTQPVPLDQSLSLPNNPELPTKFTTLGYALNTKLGVEYLRSLQDRDDIIITAQMWPHLLTNIIGSPQHDFTLPFVPASQALLPGGAHIDVRLNRQTSYAYQVPAFFLQWQPLVESLTLLDQHLSNFNLPQEFKDLPPHLSLARLDKDPTFRQTVVNLGSYLSHQGTLPNTHLTGDELRLFLDDMVPDQSVLYLSHFALLHQGSQDLINLLTDKQQGEPQMPTTSLEVVQPPATNTISREFILDPETANKQNREVFPFRPILIDTQTAHQKQIVEFAYDGSIIFRHPELTGNDPVIITPKRQRRPIESTYTDLYNTVTAAVSAGKTSPQLPPDNHLNATTLQEFVQREFETYFQEAMQAQTERRPVNLGSYVFDPLNEVMYHVAPEDVLRISMLTSHTLYDDPQGRSVYEIWQLLKHKTVAIAGASIGSNVAEAIMRSTDGTIHLADMDWTEHGNIKRMNRANLDFLGLPVAYKQDRFDPFEVHRPSKAAMVARSLLLVNPYLDIKVFLEGINHQNFAEFTRGADVLIDEVDDITAVKISLLRQQARQQGVPVFMASDIDSRVSLEVHPYHQPDTPLLNQVLDQKTLQALEKAKAGSAEDVWKLVELMIGSQFRQGPFGDYVAGRGEHTTGSLPQHGDTAMGAGFALAKLITQHFLGHQVPQRQYLQVR